MVDAQALLAAARHASLATLLDGHPYVSLVACASLDGAPLLLLSELAEHTKNLRQDARASLLVGAGDADGASDPLARGRVTFVGRCREVPAAEVAKARDAYVVAHPEATRYLTMRDFHFFRLDVEAQRTIGGFGVMGWERVTP